jgi:hypothetical protein
VSWRNDLIQRYGQVLGHAVYRHVSKYNREDSGYDYVDNWRIARADNPAEVAEYNRIAERGCCGAVNEIVYFQGVKFMIGFNYGH